MRPIFSRFGFDRAAPAEGAVAGAKVVVLNTDTQAARTATTDERGFYLAENLPIGPYTVTVDHPGFKRSRSSMLPNSTARESCATHRSILLTTPSRSRRLRAPGAPAAGTISFLKVTIGGQTLRIRMALTSSAMA